MGLGASINFKECGEYVLLTEWAAIKINSENQRAAVVRNSLEIFLFVFGYFDDKYMLVWHDISLTDCIGGPK